MNISTVILIERLLRRLRTAVIGLLLCFTACFATQSSALTLNCPAACAGILSISGCAAITQRGWPPGATVKCSCANRTFTGSPGSTDTYQETYSAPKGIELLPSTAGRVYSGNNNFDIEPYSVTTTSLSCNWTASGTAPWLLGVGGSGSTVSGYCYVFGHFIPSPSAKARRGPARGTTVWSRQDSLNKRAFGPN
jgi:hypothetical protein